MIKIFLYILFTTFSISALAEKTDKWKKEICNDTSFPPDKKKLKMREN